MTLTIARILHAGYQFSCDGVDILFDPIVENPFSRNCHAFPDVRFDLERVRALRPAAVFISHYHDDHCSLDSLDLLPRDTPIYLYCLFEELFDMLRALGFVHVHQLRTNVPVRIGPFTVTPREALDAEVDSMF
ncbi:MAG: MBL fold metallo-hydrolase, partial [Gammaproteobacteria bacterium]